MANPRKNKLATIGITASIAALMGITLLAIAMFAPLPAAVVSALTIVGGIVGAIGWFFLVAVKLALTLLTISKIPSKTEYQPIINENTNSLSSRATVATRLLQAPQATAQVSASQQTHTTENKNSSYFAQVTGFFSTFFSRRGNQNAQAAQPIIEPANNATLTR